MMKGWWQVANRKDNLLRVEAGGVVEECVNERHVELRLERVVLAHGFLPDLDDSSEAPDSELLHVLKVVDLDAVVLDVHDRSKVRVRTSASS